MDNRFDYIYFIKIDRNDIDKLKQVCIDYDINDNNAFNNAVCLIAWAIGPQGLMRISPTTFLIHKPDFNSIEELEAYLEKHNEIN